MATRRDLRRTGSATHDFQLESEKLARRKKARLVRRIVIPAVLLGVLLAWASGLAGASVTAAGELAESIRIALTPAAGWPVQTGLSSLYQLEELDGGFVALGGEGCVVYSAGGNRLRAVQPGYARPAIAAGERRFVIYNRSGTELRVEGRTRSLYTQSYENGILLCAMSRGGMLAVATGHSRYVAELKVYSSMMEEQLTWDMVDSEGTPVRMAFSEDERRLAVAALSAADGQTVCNLYLLNTRKDGETLLASVSDAVPVGLAWRSSGELLALYDSCAVLYSVSTGEEKARFDYGGDTLAGWSCQGKTTALLFQNGVSSRMVLLGSDLTVTADQGTARANGIALTRTAVYLLTDSAVECFSTAGEYQWSRPEEVKPLAVLDTKELLLFQSNSASLLEPPAE